MKSVIRVLLLSAVLGGGVYTGFLKLMNTQRAEIRALEDANDEMRQELQDREAMIERLSRTRRVAHIHILDQQRDDTGAITDTTLDFIELDDGGAELARQSFTIPGDVLYVDAWTVKFEHDRVAKGHPLFGRTLMLLRRIYSDQMAPIDGFPIDTPGGVPPGYAAGSLGLFEKKVWAHFWELAMDAQLAASMDVRVAQGEAVYKPVREGQVYELIVDAVGGMSLTPRLEGTTSLSQANE